MVVWFHNLQVVVVVWFSKLLIEVVVWFLNLQTVQYSCDGGVVLQGAAGYGGGVVSQPADCGGDVVPQPAGSGGGVVLQPADCGGGGVVLQGAAVERRDDDCGPGQLPNLIRLKSLFSSHSLFIDIICGIIIGIFISIIFICISSFRKLHFLAIHISQNLYLDLI